MNGQTEPAENLRDQLTSVLPRIEGPIIKIEPLDVEYNVEAANGETAVKIKSEPTFGSGSEDLTTHDHRGIKLKPCFVKIVVLPHDVLLKHGLELKEEKVDLQTLKRGLFGCSKCSYRSNSIKELRQHEWVHKKGTKCHTCPVCDLKFRWDAGLKFHIKNVHFKMKRYKCAVCDHRVHSEMGLKCHMATHSGSKPFECDVCDYKTNNQASLKTHMRGHAGKKPFACPHCPYRARQYPHLKHHLYVHLDVKPYECRICDFKTRQKSHLNKHVEWVHGDEKPFKCQSCGFRAKSNHTLTTHVRGQHTDERPYACKLCPFKSAHSSPLWNHRKGHERVFSIMCPHCSWSTDKPRAMEFHRMNYHPEFSNFLECRICGLKTLDPKRLLKHLKTKRHLSKISSVDDSADETLPKDAQ